MSYVLLWSYKSQLCDCLPTSSQLCAKLVSVWIVLGDLCPPRLGCTGVPSAGVRAPGLPGLVMPGGFGQHPTPAGLPSHGLRLPVMSTGLASSASASSSSTATAAVEGTYVGDFVSIALVEEIESLYYNVFGSASTFTHTHTHTHRCARTTQLCTSLHPLQLTATTLRILLLVELQ